MLTAAFGCLPKPLCAPGELQPAINNQESDQERFSSDPGAWTLDLSCFCHDFAFAFSPLIWPGQLLAAPCACSPCVSC